MANFTDQFKKRNPLTFNATGVLDMWPRQIAWETRDLLKGRTTSQLMKMAVAIEALIVDQVRRLVQNQGKMGEQHFDSNPKTISYWAKWMSIQPDQLREQYGDVNLFVAASMPSGKTSSKRTRPFEQWEGLAVLALWKLIDFYEVRSTLRKEYEFGSMPPPEKRISALVRGAPLLVESMRACTLAAEGRMRVQQLASFNDAQRTVSEALYEADSERRRVVSEKSRAAVKVRHDKTKVHVACAIELAKAGNFKSRAAAARHIADEILKASPREFYTPGTVDGWLKAAGWERKKDTSTP